MIGAPFEGLTTRWLVAGRELDGLGFGLECVDRRGRTDVLVRGATDVGVVLDGTVGVDVGALERARVAALEEHPTTTPRTHAAPATRPAIRSGPGRLTRQP